MRSGPQPRTGLTLLLALVACLVIAACGSSKKAAPQDPFVRQADAICAQGAALMRALPQASGLAQAAIVGRQGRAIIARIEADYAERIGLRQFEAMCWALQDLLDDVNGAPVRGRSA